MTDREKIAARLAAERERIAEATRDERLELAYVFRGAHLDIRAHEAQVVLVERLIRDAAQRAYMHGSCAALDACSKSIRTGRELVTIEWAKRLPADFALVEDKP